MNVGDIVKITHKQNRDLWVSGIIVKPESDLCWATARTMFDDKLIVYGDIYDYEVIRAVEPQELGSTHTTNKGTTYIRYAKNLDRRWVLADSTTLFTYTWEEITEPT
jgi:hypothetical protein